MSDSPQPPPPKPKPGSLRDRIAAFEKTGPSSSPRPPPVRPKPGNVTWKPAPPSPSATATETRENEEKKHGTMSATDAKESIGKGGSLKERMAALQGKGAFGGGISPGPPPVGPKPKKRPPLAVPLAVPLLAEESEDQASPSIKQDDDRGRSELHAEATAGNASNDLDAENITVEPKEDKEDKEDKEEAAPDDEEAKERERRAAIAARMARLGGARVGMAPPVFGKKPVVKEKPREDLAEDLHSKEATPPGAPGQSTESGEQQVVEPSLPLKIPSLHPEVTTSAEVIQVESDSPRVATDESISSSETRATLLPRPAASSPTSPSESPPSLDPESRPTGESLPQSSINTASRSPPTSMPIPAAPRRAGPPRSKGGRKVEAKKVEEEPLEGPKNPPEAQIQPVEASGESVPIQHESSSSARQESGSIHESTTDHDVLDTSKAAIPEAHFTAPDSMEPVNERELTQLSSQSLIEVADEEPHRVFTERHARSRTEDVDSSKTQVESHTSTTETSVVMSAQSMANLHESEPESPVHESGTDEPPSPETAVSGEQVVDVNYPQAENDVLDPNAINDTVELSPVVSHTTKEPEETTDISPLRHQMDSEQSQATAAEEDETEDEEAFRRQRIAERLAKMGALNPFAANPLRGASLPRQASGGEVHDPLHVSSCEDRSVVEQDYQNPLFEVSSIEMKDPEGDGQEPRFGGLEEAWQSGVTAAAALLEEPEETEFEHSATPHASHPEREDLAEMGLPEHESLISVEEVEEMGPPRTFRPVPPLPPPRQASVEESSYGVETQPRYIPQRRSIPPPPEENLVARHQPTLRDDDDNPKARSASPEEVYVGAHAPPPISIPAVKGVSRRESGSDSSSLSPTSRRSIPSPPNRAVPAPSSVGSTEFHSPTSTSSRKSFPPPPRRVLSHPREDPHAGAELSPSTSPKAISPPTRPPPVPQVTRSMSSEVSPTVFRPVSARRSMSSHASAQAVDEVMPSADEVTSATTEDGELSSTDVSADAVSPQAVVFPTPERQIAQRDLVEEQEVLAESDPDPIDPAIYSPPRTPATPRDQRLFRSNSGDPFDNNEEDTEQSRRRTIAERMAKLGGIKFGAPPTVPRRPVAPPPEIQSSHEGSKGDVEQRVEIEDDTAQVDAVVAEETESEEALRARRQAIAARLAGMGGMRFGMLPQMSVPAHPRDGSDDSARTSRGPSSLPQRPAHAPPAPPADSATFDGDSESVSDEGVKVEAGSELSMEEVYPEEAEEEAEEIPPPIPSRPSRPSHPPPTEVAPPLPPGRRPPVPTSSSSHRPPVPKIEPKRFSADSSRKPSLPPVSPIPSSGDYIMVDENQEVPPPPRSRPPRAIPPPAPVSKELDSSPWELPEIPRGSFDVNVLAGLDESISLEDSTTYPSLSSAPQAGPNSARVPAPAAARADVSLSADELLELWGAVGTAVHAAASALFDKSKKSVVGDGTSRGFVNAALAQVPQASKASYGHLIYSQTGNSVLRRSSNIMPGDIVQLTEAKLKGHKGLQSYHQAVGTAQEPLFAIVSEVDGKKSKVKVFQANQHVGSQTVESASYRLDDLKSGSVKVFRVASA